MPSITPDNPAHVIHANAQIWQAVASAVRDADWIQTMAGQAHTESKAPGDNSWTAARVFYARSDAELARARALVDFLIYAPDMRRDALKLIAATRRGWKG